MSDLQQKKSSKDWTNCRILNPKSKAVIWPDMQPWCPVRIRGRCFHGDPVSGYWILSDGYLVSGHWLPDSVDEVNFLSIILNALPSFMQALSVDSAESMASRVSRASFCTSAKHSTLISSIRVTFSLILIGIF